MVEAFKETFGAAEVYHDQDNQRLWKMHKWSRFVEIKIQPYRKYKERESYRVIHGHFRIEKYRSAFPDAFYLTFYRHPLQVMASMYFFWMRVSNPSDTNPLRRWVYEEKPSIVDFVARYLEEGDLQERGKLDAQHFNFVGITERLEDSMRLLKRHIPELVIEVDAARVNPEKPVGLNYTFSHDDEQKLTMMLSPLIRLYEDAVKKFEVDIAANKLDKADKQVEHLECL